MAKTPASTDAATAITEQTESLADLKHARRVATAARLIEHDGETFEEGDPIFLTKDEFKPLAAVGAVVETDWDDLDEI